MKNIRIKRLSRKGRLLLSAGIVLAVLLGAWFGVQAWLGHEVTRLLESEPINLDGSAYTTDIKSVRVDLARRSITLRGVSLKNQKGTRTRKDGPIPLLEARAARVSASGIHFRKGKGDKPGILRIRTIRIDTPDITFEGVPGTACDTCGTPNAALRKMRLSVERFAVTGATIRAGVWQEGEKHTFAATGLDATLRDIALGDTLSGGKTPKAALSALSLSAGQLAYTLKNGALKVEAVSLAVDSEAGTFAAARLALLPQYDKYQYALRVGDHTDWLALDVREVAGTGLRLPFPGNDQLLHADSVRVGSVAIASYKDRNQPQSPAVRPMLYTSVQRIPAGFDIPFIDVRHIDIRYEEVSQGATLPGVITFTDMAARITGLTNRPARESQQYRIDAEGYLLGGARVRSTLALPADSRNDFFALAAEVGPMSATIASPVTEPIANIRIVSGSIHSVTVALSGNSREAQATVEMPYDDLQIAILHKNDPDRQRKLLTTIANDMVLHRSNPEGDRLRIGHGRHERDPYKSFWNYLWKTSFVGVADIVM